MTTRTGVILLALVGGIVACWVLLMPPGAGPDEHSHLVRAGAVIRGDWGDSGAYVLPDTYRAPEPSCYAFDPTISARCASTPIRTGTEVSLVSRATDYPIWSHAVYGMASLAPGLTPLWWARAVGAALSAGVVTWALRTAIGSRPLAATAVLVGLTPMAWSVFATINPSSFVTAGAVALWVGLLGRARPAINQSLVAVGWAALALPRRARWTDLGRRHVGDRPRSHRPLRHRVVAIARCPGAHGDRDLHVGHHHLGRHQRRPHVPNDRSRPTVSSSAAEAGRWWWERPDTPSAARYLELAGLSTIGHGAWRCCCRAAPAAGTPTSQST